jgi:NADH-quinone oxidoreductase subunit N
MIAAAATPISATAPIANQPIDWHAIAPLVVLAGTALVVLFVDLFLRPERKWISMVLSFIGTLGALAAALSLAGSDRSTFGGMFVVDSFTVLFQVFFLSVCLAVLLLSYRYFRDARLHQGEYYFLLLCSFLGCLTMPGSRDLIMLFISLEMVSAPAFLITGLRKTDPKSNEAALKFFLISVLSTAVMLYGMSLIYGVTGTTRLDGIAKALANPATSAGGSALAKAAVLFVVAGFAFKVSAFPFQFWAPDTYEGAPVPVAAYLSVASKAAGFAGLLQLMFVAFLPLASFWTPIFAILSLFTMFVGNLVALQQKQVVRLLAYSSIAQAGYILLPFALAGHSASVDKAAFAATVLYLLIYAVTNLGAFAVVTGVSRSAPSMLISDFDGLGQRAPAMAAAMTMCLISLAGIPILAGFWGKFFIFQAAIDRGGVGTWLAAAMVVNSVISVVYYISIARAMYFEPLREPVTPLRLPGTAALVAVLAAVGVIAIGVFPPLVTHFPSVSTLVGH